MDFQAIGRWMLYGAIIYAIFSRVVDIYTNWMKNHKKFDGIDHFLHICYAILYYMLFAMVEAIRQGPLPPQ